MTFIFKKFQMYKINQDKNMISHLHLERKAEQL